uniref:Uncharacterized protein n=1 Tax=Nelumbo nucifera TaxID=4432 RepID=A0A822ZV22_NELNU|nr:TPA_asm: hypothetical protein HUJ06_003968 [Nelumbo nucifera]
MLKESFDSCSYINPISLKDIDESNEWLLGEMDGAEDELVFQGDSLTWGDVARASGVEEPPRYTRSRGSSTTSQLRAKWPKLTNSKRPSTSNSQLHLEDEDEFDIEEKTEEENMDDYKSDEYEDDFWLFRFFYNLVSTSVFIFLVQFLKFRFI